jgi:hypothetical protein
MSKEEEAGDRKQKPEAEGSKQEKREDRRQKSGDRKQKPEAES